jgi:hypothetical protein
MVSGGMRLEFRSVFFHLGHRTGRSAALEADRAGTECPGETIEQQI